MTYTDDAKFRVRTFDSNQRSDDEIKRSELDVNQAIGLDETSMPVDSFHDPQIVCEFIDGPEQLFVTLIQNSTKNHYHFIYDTASNQLKGQAILRSRRKARPTPEAATRAAGRDQPP